MLPLISRKLLRHREVWIYARKREIPRGTRYHKERDTTTWNEIPRARHYQVGYVTKYEILCRRVRVTKKCEIPRSARYQEVRDTMKSKYHKLLNTAKYKIPRRTLYQEIRGTPKYEIPQSTSYHEVRDTMKYNIPQTTRYHHIRHATQYPRWPQDGPRWPQDGPKVAPR